MVVVAPLNATLRELFVTPAVGADTAHLVSTATLLVALGVLVVDVGRVPDHIAVERRLIGVMWAGLTVAFELGVGHYVAGDSWASIPGQYDVTAGRVWVFVPLFLLVTLALLGRYAER